MAARADVAFFRRALSKRLRSAPGVSMSPQPRRCRSTDRTRARSRDRASHRAVPFPVRVHPRIVSADYFRTLGFPGPRARVTDHDAARRATSPIVNESAARPHCRTKIRSGSGSAWARRRTGGRLSGSSGISGMKARRAMPTGGVVRNVRGSSKTSARVRARNNAGHKSGGRRGVSDFHSFRTLSRASDPLLSIGIGASDGRFDRRVGCARGALNYVLVSTFSRRGADADGSRLYGVRRPLWRQRTRESACAWRSGATEVRCWR